MPFKARGSGNYALSCSCSEDSRVYSPCNRTHIDCMIHQAALALLADIYQLISITNWQPVVASNHQQLQQLHGMVLYDCTRYNSTATTPHASIHTHTYTPTHTYSEKFYQNFAAVLSQTIQLCCWWRTQKLFNSTILDIDYNSVTYNVSYNTISVYSVTSRVHCFSKPLNSLWTAISRITMFLASRLTQFPYALASTSRLCGDTCIAKKYRVNSNSDACCTNRHIFEKCKGFNTPSYTIVS